MKNVLLVGLGNMGSKYFNLLSKMDINLTLCDIDETKLRDKGYPYITNLENIKDIAYGIIATDPKKHVELAKKILEKNANVLIEKPPATSYDELYSLKDFENKIHISEIERFSMCIKEFPKHITPKYIHIKRLNKGSGYINPLWDLAWHDLYNLFYLFKDVSIKSLNTGHIWRLEGFVKNEIPFVLEVAWNHHFVDRNWQVKTEKGMIFMNFADEEITLEDGYSYRRKEGNKLLDMINEFLDDMPNESYDRALGILRILDEFKP